MLATPQNSKVLVTEAHGVAMWIIRTLLEAGHSVRGTVRSVARCEHVAKMFKKYNGKLELIIVPDIEAEGAFDEAVHNVDAVAHLASPYRFHAAEPDESIQLALRGTIGILSSVLKHGHNVKRVVITSSTAAAVRQSGLPATFSEEDWNDEAVESVQAQGKSASSLLIYFASKVLAEKAAYEFLEKHKNKVNWDIVTILPPAIFGPSLSEMPSPASLNQSMMSLYDIFLEDTTDPATLASFGNAWVDVRDVAHAQVRALERPEAHGRVIVSWESFKLQDWLNAAANLKDAVHDITFDTAKMKRLLGIPREELITMEQTAHDILEDFQQRGW